MEPLDSLNSGFKAVSKKELRKKEAVDEENFDDMIINSEEVEEIKEEKEEQIEDKNSEEVEETEEETTKEEDTISEKTLKTIDSSIKNLKEGKAGESINFEQYQDIIEEEETEQQGEKTMPNQNEELLNLKNKVEVIEYEVQERNKRITTFLKQLEKKNKVHGNLFQDLAATIEAASVAFEKIQDNETKKAAKGLALAATLKLHDQVNGI